MTRHAWAVVCVVCVSCKSSSHATVDSRSGDAPSTDSASVDVPPGPDAPPPDAPDPSRVWVHVTDTTGDGGPDASAVVVFMDSSGAVVQDGTVDASGDASVELPGGGSVTVLQVSIDPGTGAHQDRLMTFRGVKPGDFLHAGPARAVNTFSGPSYSMTAHLPLDAYQAQLYFECGNGTTIGPPNGLQTLTFYDSCRTSSFDVLMMENMSGVAEFVWQPGLTFADHGDVTIADNFALMAKTSSPITNVPPGLSNVGVWLYTNVGALRVGMDQQSVQLPSGGDQTIALRYPPGAGTSTLLYAAEFSALSSTQSFARVTTGSPATIGLDLASLPLPTISTRAMQTPSTVTWTQSDAGAPDARYVTWLGSWTDAGTNTKHTAVWGIVEDPSGTTSSSLVPLPPAYAADDPSHASNPTLLGATVAYVDYDNLGGYDQARPFGFILLDPSTSLPTVSHTAHVSGSP